MAKVALAVDTDEDISVSVIVEELINDRIFNYYDGSAQSLMYQLVCMSLGWLCMLYGPKLKPKKDMLQLANGTQFPRRYLRSYKIRNFEQNFDQIAQPLPTLFRFFGHVTPQLLTIGQYGSSSPKEREYLMLSYLNYHTLNRVCNIRVEWVDCISMHLELSNLSAY